MKNEGQIGLSRYLLFSLIALSGAAFDQVTKTIVFSKVGPPGSKQSLVPPILDLRTSYNTGISGVLGLGSRTAASCSRVFPSSRPE